MAQQRGSVRDYLRSETDDRSPLLSTSSSTTPRTFRRKISIADVEADEQSCLDNCCYVFFKAFILFCISLLGWSMFLAMDLQAGLENQFQAEDGANMTHTTFNNFMTFFSIPNIPGSIVGGFLVKWITHRKGSPIFVMLMIVGQLIGAYGAVKSSTSMLFIGRSVFGLACELTNICTFEHIMHWFKGPIYNFAFALVVAMARLGTVTIMIGGPVLVEILDKLTDADGNKLLSSSIQITYIYLGTTIMLLVALLAAVYLMAVTKYPEETEDVEEKQVDSKRPVFEDSEDLTIKGKLKGVLELAKLPPPCWLVIFICMIFYAAVEPWVIGAKTSFEKYHGVTNFKFSATLSAIISIVPIPLGPLLGLMVDAVKCNAWWCLSGSLLSIFGHLTLMTHHFAMDLVSPVWMLLTANILIGMGYCMVAGSIWSLLSYTVPKHQTSVAYGIVQAFQHIGIIFATMVSAALVDGAKDVSTGYFNSEMFFMIVLMVSLFLCIFFVVIYGSGSKSMFEEDSSEKKN